MNLIKKYYPLSEKQEEQFAQLFSLYPEWNEKINLISRKDIDNLELHHFVHSLAIYSLIPFVDDARILDLGCGGGFPGIMLAIMMPEVNFTLIDARNKKIVVVKDVADQLGLKNVFALHGRAEELKAKKFDFVVTRAVAPINKLKLWTQSIISEEQKHSLPNGIIALKGGDTKKETALLKKKDYHEIHPLSKFFTEDYFSEKYILYLQH